MEDFELEQELIQNRMKRFGQQGYQEPQGQMVGNQFVAPNVLQHLAAGLRGYGAIKGQAGAEQELKDLRGKRRDAETRDMSAFVSALRGTPENAPSPDFEGNAVGPTMPAKPGDPMAAYSLAAASQSPTIRQMGMRGMAEMPQIEARRQERVDDRTFRQSEAELAREARKAEQEAARVARMEQLQEQQAMRMQMLQEQNASREQMMQSQQDFQREMKKLTPPRAPTVIANGTMVLGPEGVARPIVGPDGKPLASNAGQKPMPSFVLKIQDDALEKIGISSSINADLGALETQIDQGKLTFGPVSNLANKALNVAGVSTEQSRNFSSFKSTLERLRNESLRLNAGVQTDGDAQRAWNELFSDLTDEKLVKQRLQEIQRINARGTELQTTRLNSTRQQYGFDPYDTSGISAPAPAVGTRGAPQANPQDAAALQWARSNPNDPRSRAILQRLGQ
jgi:hypothetical protein